MLPFKLPDAPQLEEQAAGELPAANQPLSKSKGYFSLFVFRALFWIVLGLSIIIIYMVMTKNSDQKTEIKELKAQVTLWQDRYIMGLQQKSEEVEKLMDTTATIKQQVR